MIIERKAPTNENMTAEPKAITGTALSGLSADDEEILGQTFTDEELKDAETPADGHVTTMNGITGKYQNGIFSGDPFTGFTPPDASGTGLMTSDDEEIVSSYGDDNDFYTQIELNDMIDNTPSGAMSYRGYLAYNGLRDPRIDYNDAVSAANDEYMRALPGYGAGGEQFGRMGLNGSGYSEYFGGVAYSNRARAISEAQRARQEKEGQYRAQYAEYLKDFTPTGGTTRKSAAVYSSLLSAMPTTENGIEAVRQAALAEGYSAADIDAAIKQYRAGNMGNAASSAILDIYNQSSVNEAMLPAMRTQLKAKGYTDSQIDAAEKQWKEMQTAAIRAGFTDVTSVGAATAADLRAAYGTGELYTTALSELQRKNGELIDAALTAALQSQDINTSEVIKAFPDLAGSEEWAKMDPDEKITAIRDRIKNLYDAGEISEATYHDANFRMRKNSVELAIEAGHLNDALENVYQISKDPGEVSSEQKEEIFGKVFDRISFSVSGNTYGKDGRLSADLYMSFDGKKTLLQRDCTTSFDVDKEDGTVFTSGVKCYVAFEGKAYEIDPGKMVKYTREQCEALSVLIQTFGKDYRDLDAVGQGAIKGTQGAK